MVICLGVMLCTLCRWGKDCQGGILRSLSLRGRVLLTLVVLALDVGLL